MQQLIDWLLTVPAPLWTLVGVIFGSAFSNRAAEKRLRAQFEHERSMKTQDRELNLRKDVYLEAATALSAGVNAIQMLPNLEADAEKLTKDFIDRSPSIAKVYLVGNSTTSLAMLKCVTELRLTFVEMVLRRAQLMGERSEVVWRGESAKTIERERDKYLELMKQMNITGERNDAKFKVLSSGYEFETKRLETLNEERLSLGTSLEAKRQAFFREAQEASHQLASRLLPLLHTVREDLKVDPLDEVKFLGVLDGSHEQVKVRFDTFFRSVARD